MNVPAQQSLARDIRHARQVAIKVLHPELAAVPGADGQLFYVMPFVEGETLRTRLERETQLPVADAVQLVREVAGAPT